MLSAGPSVRASPSWSTPVPAPDLQSQNRWVRLSVSTRAILTIDKMGLLAYAKKAGIKI